jgi:chromosome segregation ATPase
MKGKRIPTWPGDFCKKARISKSTLGRYAAVAKAVNEYGWQSAPRNMRPSPSTTAEQRLLQSQILSEHESWKAEKDHLQRQLGEAQKRIASLSAAEKAAIERIAQLENIIDVLVWRLVRLDKRLGPELEEALRATATGNRNHDLILISKPESGEGEISGR